MAQQAHAEGELMQFLQERYSHYTHIVAIGCSRPHCYHCKKMLEGLIEKDILEKTSYTLADITIEMTTGVLLWR